MNITILTSVSASERYPGVIENQSLHYKVDTFLLGGNDTERMNDTNEIDAWYNVTVLAVSGKLVTLRYAWFNATGIVDISIAI